MVFDISRETIEAAEADDCGISQQAADLVGTVDAQDGQNNTDDKPKRRYWFAINKKMRFTDYSFFSVVCEVIFIWAHCLKTL